MIDGISLMVPPRSYLGMPLTLVQQQTVAANHAGLQQCCRTLGDWQAPHSSRPTGASPHRLSAAQPHEKR